MRIIQLSTASSPAHIEWDTLSQFLSPGIYNLTHHAHHESLSRRLYKNSLKSPASRIEGMLVKTQMVCLNAPKEKRISNRSLRTNTVHVLTYFHEHR